MKRQRQLFLTTTYCLFVLPGLCRAFVPADALVDFALGATAGATGAFVSYPADYVTCQMQTESGKRKYKNGLDCFVRTIAEEGPLQLFRGVSVQITGTVPEKAVKLGVNDMAKCWLSGGGFRGLSIFDEILAGSIAGVCQVVATCPLEVLKVSLQTSNSTLGEILSHVGGLPGLYRGAEACIVRDVMLSATLFPIYTHAHEILPAFMAGALAGLAAGVVGAPGDFVKTRILSRDANENNNNDEHHSSSNNGFRRSDLPSILLPRQPAFVSAAASAASLPLFMLEYRSDGGLDGFLDETVYKKTRVAADKKKQQETTNPFVIAKDIAKKEGWEVLFTGVGERCIASIPRYGVTLSLYDFLKVFALTHGWLGAPPPVV